MELRRCHMLPALIHIVLWGSTVSKQIEYTVTLARGKVYLD